MSLAIGNPYPIVLDLLGVGLSGGSVYIGLANQDPESFPQAVYWDSALTIPASQPLQVTSGYIYRLGSPATPYTSTSYSIRVRNAQGVQVFYNANVTAVPVPTVQKFTSGSGTYTRPTGVTWIDVTMVGGGGGGGGGGTTGGTGGGTGGTTTFGSSLLTATGGVGGGAGGSGGSSGGSATVAAGPLGIGLSGGGGGGSATQTVINQIVSGGAGGNSALGGGGASAAFNSAGIAGATNTGGGGSGGGGGNVVNTFTGAAGGGGGYVSAIIGSPSATYAYAVGAAGTAGTAGTSGSAGGAGGSGVIIVVEHYGP